MEIFLSHTPLRSPANSALKQQELLQLRSNFVFKRRVRRATQREGSVIVFTAPALVLLKEVTL